MAKAKEACSGLSQLIDYFGLAADGVVVTKTGTHMAAWEFRGIDMDTLPDAETFAVMDRLGRQLGLGAGWSVQCDLIRREAAEYMDPPESWPSPGAQIIEEERRYRFLEATGRYATRMSRYYFCLSYDPKGSGGRGVAGRVMGIDDGQSGEPEAVLEKFLAKVDEIEGVLRSCVKSIHRLKGYVRYEGGVALHCDECLEYLRECVSGDRFPFTVPEDASDLNLYMAVDDFTGGAEPELGDPRGEVLSGVYISVLAVDSFPAKSFAGMLRLLDAVPRNFRFSHQAAIKDEIKAAKDHGANAKAWSGKGKGGLKGTMMPVDVHKMDGHALNLAGDASAAESEAEHGLEFFVKYSGKVIVMSRSKVELRDTALEVRQALRRAGFNCRAEDVNGVAAWLGSLPGHQEKDARTFSINTRNLACMMPLSAPFLGLQYNPSKYFPAKSPPLFMGLTAGGAPYRFHAQVEDVGHAVVIGPNGSGKSSLIALGMASAMRFEDFQIYGFDKKRSLYTATTFLGGTFADLNAQDMRFCPLASLETADDLQWANQYVALLAGLNGLGITPEIVNDIEKAVFQLSRSRAAKSLTALHAACSLTPLKEALRFYLTGILNGDRDELEVSRFVTFEMDGLYSLDPKLVNGILFYIFGRIKRRLREDVPTFMFVDEFRAALSHPIAAKAFEDFLFEGRKLNLAVWLIVQELTQTLQSPLRGAVLGQTRTKICLPNPQAILDDQENYGKLGCTAVDRAAIAAAIPKRDYYHVIDEGPRRMISAEMGPVLLTLLDSGDRARARISKWIVDYGRDEACARWLQCKGLQPWADRYRNLADTEGPNRLLYAAKEAAVYA